MAPQVRKVKSAFLFYQGEELKRVRDELGVSMGEAMTEVSYDKFLSSVWPQRLSAPAIVQRQTPNPVLFPFSNDFILLNTSSPAGGGC